MAWRSAPCSNRRSEVQAFPNISVQITTRCIAFINGKPTSGFCALPKSKRFLTFRSRTICGTVDRHNQKRMFGPNIILDGGRSGIETVCFQKLLQRVPKPRVFGRKDADRSTGIERHRFQIISLAETLSWVIPNVNSGMNTNSPGTGFCHRPSYSTDSGQLR